jgi:hypothetical protein
LAPQRLHAAKYISVFFLPNPTTQNYRAALDIRTAQKTPQKQKPLVVAFVLSKY